MRAATIMVAIGELEEIPLRLEAHQVLLSSKPTSLQGSDLGTAERSAHSAVPKSDPWRLVGLDDKRTW